MYPCNATGQIMKISEYIKEYTAGNRITFRFVMLEVSELIVEMLRLDGEGIKEEFGDVFHFLQLWLYWRFGIDGRPWKMTRHSVDKFMGRKKVWNRLYEFVGLPKNISGYVGNYQKKHKVIRQLEKLGISREKAEQAYLAIVSK